MNNNNLAAAAMRPSRYQNFYGDETTAVPPSSPPPPPQGHNQEDNINRNARDANDSTANNAVAAATTTNQQLSGWSLTLAGTYREDMAPDVEMRLSFPKKPNHNAVDAPLSSPPLPLQAAQALTFGERSRIRNRVQDQSVSSERTFTAQHPAAANDNSNASNNNIFYEQSGGEAGDLNENLMSASRSSNIIGGSSVEKNTNKPQLPMNPKRTLMAKACTGEPRYS